MSRLFIKISSLVLLFGYFSSSFAEVASPIVYRNFWQPYYHGVRLNYCTLDGVCGRKVANYYCQMMGYHHADHDIIANNVGLTRYLSAPGKCPVRATCKGWQCDGFKTIRCASKLQHRPPKYYHYSKRRFVFPRYNDYRVAYCYDGVSGCGRRAAYSFCRRLGYKQVVSFKMEKGIAATQAIGNQKLCFGPLCQAFSEIDCSR